MADKAERIKKYKIVYDEIMNSNVSRVKKQTSVLTHIKESDRDKDKEENKEENKDRDKKDRDKKDRKKKELNDYQKFVKKESKKSKYIDLNPKEKLLALSKAWKKKQKEKIKKLKY